MPAAGVSRHRVAPSGVPTDVRSASDKVSDGARRPLAHAARRMVASHGV